MIRRELAEPIDVRGAAPALALAADDMANPVIHLRDESGDTLQYKQHVRDYYPFIRRNFGHTAISGDPDLSAITEIAVSDWSGDQGRDVWIDDLHFVPRITEAAYCSSSKADSRRTTRSRIRFSRSTASRRRRSSPPTGSDRPNRPRVID